MRSEWWSHVVVADPGGVSCGAGGCLLLASARRHSGSWLGVFVGGGVALAALLYPDPSQTDPYPPYQVFAAVIGVVSSVLWLFGGSVGIVTGFALWPSKPQKNS